MNCLASPSVSMSHEKKVLGERERGKGGGVCVGWVGVHRGAV